MSVTKDGSVTGPIGFCEEVTPIGGLGNRLRVIFSFLISAPNKQLRVNWNPNEEVSFAKFEDLFLPISGVYFDRNARGTETCSAKTWSVDWQKLLKLNLHPVPSIQQRIDNTKEILGEKYLAIHVRRTDHTSLAQAYNKFTPDEDFLNWVVGFPVSFPLYIATDNEETWLKFSSVIKNRKVIKGVAVFSAVGKRFTTAMDSVVDIFVCSGSMAFKGSGYSSFSDLINFIRRE